MTNLPSERAVGKVSKVRFAPSIGYEDTTLLFASGTWDEEEENVISLWKAEQKPPPLHMILNAYDTKVVGEVKQPGDISDLCFISTNYLVAASSRGTINAYRLVEMENLNEQETSDGTDLLTEKIIELEKISSQTLHNWSTTANNYYVSATGLAIEPDNNDDLEIASVGEDGKLVFSRITDTMTEIIDADTGIINGLVWPTSHEIVIATSGGRLKKFDRRNPRTAVAVAKTEGKGLDRLTCLTVNPNKTMQLASGSANGVVSIWDSRNLVEPLKKFEPHKLSIWDIVFHPNRSETVLSCSEDASIAILDLSKTLLTSYLRGRDEIPRLPNNFNCAPLNSLDYHPSAKLLVSGSDDARLFFDKLNDD
ncbi:1460_t:CDS:2 [Ambispora gerdemannii]|uniref:1460_t:CDS:1 n=1 Tax=Ambispora gerdemannii TaxID=144530 RepID=A0A9N9ANQ9_9GLOM|nr:1460_t:CDS:2 [Ambispora gerdemannii]